MKSSPVENRGRKIFRNPFSIPPEVSPARAPAISAHFPGSGFFAPIKKGVLIVNGGFFLLTFPVCHYTFVPFVGRKYLFGCRIASMRSVMKPFQFQSTL